MKTEIKQKWVDALRSGEYKQGKWKLTRIDDYTDIMGQGKERFCVLGVLCDIAVKDGMELPIGYDRDYDKNAEWIEFRVYQSMWNEEEGEYDDTNSTDLPDEVLRWAGLDENPVVVYDEQSATLTELNDLLDVPFSTLATLIDEQL